MAFASVGGWLGANAHESLDRPRRSLTMTTICGEIYSVRSRSVQLSCPRRRPTIEDAAREAGVSKTTAGLRQELNVMISGTFLRKVMGWNSEDLEKVRHRTWRDIPMEDEK